MKLTFIPMVHHMQVRQNINLMNGFGGKETNNLKKLPINNIRIPICKEPFAVDKKPLVLKHQKINNPKTADIKNKKKFIIIKLNNDLY